MPPVDEKKLNAFVGKMVGDLGAAASGALVLLGDRLGLYAALAGQGPATSTQLAERTQCYERYVREWLACQAASGYVDYDSATETFSMNPEQAAVLADPNSPAAMVGGYFAMASIYIDEPQVETAFRTGRGIPWGDHHNCLFCGTERFFRPGYEANIVHHWLPALDGVIAKLERGAHVADVGCGWGASTFIMARAFPKSKFTGFDLHAESIEESNRKAQHAGLDNLKFAVASAKNFTGHEYDLVTVFDALHDMGDPVGVAAQICRHLKPDGTWMLVEPMAGDSLSANLNPVGRVFYAFSTMICTPCAMSQGLGVALGAQAGEARLRKVLEEAGFTRIRRAAETPFNMILEARP